MAGAHTVSELIQGTPTFLLFGVALVAAVAWTATHAAARRGPSSRRRRVVAFALRAAVGFLTLLLASLALGRVFVLATNWPLWPIALAGALTVEFALSLYRIERSVVRPRASRAIGVLRVCLVLLVVLMLAQPVFTREMGHQVKRAVAVLVDESGSMQAPDTQLTVPEKLRLAEVFSDRPIKRPFRLDDAAADLDWVRGQLKVQTEWLKMLGGLAPDVLRQHLQSRRSALHDVLSQAATSLDRQQKVLAQALQDSPLVTPEARAALSDLSQRFTTGALQPIKAAVDATAEGNQAALEAQHSTLLEQLSGADEALARLTPDFQEQGRKLDQAFYDSLPQQDRSDVDSFARLSRADLARAVLLLRPLGGRAGAGRSASAGPDTGSLLDRLQAQYDVKLYAFAAEPVQVNVNVWRGSPEGAPLKNTGETNLAAAIEQVSRDVPSEQLAGIVLLSDGRHNAPDRIEPIARALGLAEVPICPIVIGAREPPKDAAIVSLSAPEVVHAKDTMDVAVEVKLDGLKGQKAQVKLFREGTPDPVDTREILVPSDEYRKHVELADTPETAGLHSYRVTVTSFDGEVFAGNNEYPLTVNVTEELTQLLIIEGRPRWEFRYLKNLFESRDVSVKLQYVLLRPDQIGGTAPLPQVAASAARPREAPQATLLPKGDMEWTKFDVIILGDVPPDALSPDDYEALRRFVSDRGGTLIVVAGPDYMPRAFGATPLRDMLPVQFEAKDGPVAAPEESFHIALTPEGRESVIMRQAVEPEENLEVWRSLPPAYWRHPILDVKPGATVLAYALPDSGPEAAIAAKPEQPEDFQRTHALIAVQQVALGQVLMLNYDQTWRMRYRAGDTRHHKFWGQILRWATAGKLPAGTSLVKLGTDKSRYAPHSDVNVRAKLLQPDLSPLANAEVAVNVYHDTHVVLRKTMAYMAGSNGIYAANLGELPPGTYRVELDCPQATPILASENTQTVSTEFAVDPATSDEQVELSVDRGLLGRLAELSGGKVFEPTDAYQVPSALRASVFTRSRNFEFVLWNSGPFLAIIMMIGAAEWFIRRRSGLP